MMWELISQNRKKSRWLFAGMAVLLALLGFSIGTVWLGEHGGIIGTVIAIALWGTMALVSINAGGDILLHVAGAKEVTKDVHPRLFNVVEEMKIAAGLPAMPRVYIIDEQAPNAFAIGVNPEKSSVAVTAGLLSRLNRDELQGVIAHETAHILNRDSQLMTVAGIMLGSIVLISQVFLRGMWFMPSSGKRYRKSDSGGSPQLQLIMVVVAIALAILAPIFARLLYLAISRKREYLADATAVRLTRYPDGLAGALEKISSADIPLDSANQVTAPMYIASPLARKGSKLSSLDSTHPPIEERIRILRSMTAGADLAAYQKAFSNVTGETGALIPSSGLKKSKHLSIRKPSSDTEPAPSAKKSVRDAVDIMRAVNGYAFLVCACGLKIKLPPEHEGSTVVCPKCGRENTIPTAELASVGAAIGATVGARSEAGSPQIPAASHGEGRFLEYKRKGRGWETFLCSCGRLMQLSPAFSGRQLSCNDCGRVIQIK